MGWCSGTEIMDAAVEAADKLLEGAYGALGVDSERVTLEDIRPQMDELMKPYVRTIARKLHDGDWDCVEEANAFERFPQEMYDYDDREYETWLRERLKDASEYGEAEDVLLWSTALKKHTDKMEAGNA